MNTNREDAIEFLSHLKDEDIVSMQWKYPAIFNKIPLRNSLLITFKRGIYQKGRRKNDIPIM